MQAKRPVLSDRQRREIEYHREHAALNADLLKRRISFDVLRPEARHWWNAYWEMYHQLKGGRLSGKRVLVVGCGFGDDALRLAKLGAEVYAFDLSPDSLAIARELAAREGLDVDFRQMPAEHLEYEDSFFDYVIARDIFHHVDIPLAIAEIERVSKDGGILVVNEIYSHSVTDRIRHSWLVNRKLYPAMRSFIYGRGKPYITADERKLNERDVAQILGPMRAVLLKRYFNFLVTRIVPERFDVLNKLDQALLILAGPLGLLLAGRILIVGVVGKGSAAQRAGASRETSHA